MLGLKTTLGLSTDCASMQLRSEQVQIHWVDFPSGPSVEGFKYDL